MWESACPEFQAPLHFPASLTIFDTGSYYSSTIFSLPSTEHKPKDDTSLLRAKVRVYDKHIALSQAVSRRDTNGSRPFARDLHSNYG